MGGGSYSVSNRSVRAQSMGYSTKSVNDVFEQNKKKQMHESMDPKDIKIREARDSAEHPNTVPIIVGLDVTGSMGHIPHDLIKTGLPHMMGTIIEKGTPDPALLFMAIGDIRNDTCPLQVGQFEAGDEQLDTWLTRSYLEGNGGGNGGESYHLAWYFAAYHTQTDAWDKRQEKGFLFTTGDEPCHPSLSKNEVSGIMNNCAIEKSHLSNEELLAEVRKRYHVYHIHIDHGNDVDSRWKDMLGENVLVIRDPQDVAKTIADVIVNYTKPGKATPSKEDTGSNTDTDGVDSVPPKITL